MRMKGKEQKGKKSSLPRLRRGRTAPKKPPIFGDGLFRTPPPPMAEEGNYPVVALTVKPLALGGSPCYFTGELVWLYKSFAVCAWRG